MRPVRIVWIAAVLAFSTLGWVVGALCAQEVRSQPVEGFWRGVQEDQVWAFVFQFTADDRAGYSGVIHVYQNDQKVQEVPIDEVSVKGNKIALRVKMNGVAYQGDVDPEKGIIKGEFQYKDGSTLAMILHKVDPATLPGLSARDTAGGKPYDYEYTVPDSLGDGWQVSNLESQGFDPATIGSLVRAITAGDFGFLHSLLIVRNGKLVLEEYFYGHDRDTPHRMASATKSVTSLLIGIAIDRGLIAGPSQKVLTFFPTYASKAALGWGSVTLAHLLTMSSGAAWAEDDLKNFYESQDRFGKVLEQPIVGIPGERFEYISPNVDLLAGVIKQACGMYADQFAEKYLFAPLGIHDYKWDYGKWEGHPLMDGSLALKSRDMAKLGQLVLDGGEWKGTQVVSSAWITESTAKKMDVDGPEDYGYLWWRSSAPFQGRMIEGVFASGMGSQFIFVIPEYDVVVVTTGGNDDNSMHLAPLRMFPDYILPSMR